MDKSHLFFAVNYFAQGMAGIVYEPLSYYLKDALGLSAGQSAGFLAWMTFPFLIKPFFGLLSDLLPVAGRRRLPQFVVFAALGTLSWLVLAGSARPDAGRLLFWLIAANVALVATDVICDGIMVEHGQKNRKTGIYQAVSIGTLYAALVATGLGGGYLAAHVPMNSIFALAALFPLMTALSAVWIEERPVADAAMSPGFQGLASLLLSGRFWAVSALIFLWSFFPHLGTVQFYYQTQSLGLDPIFIGGMSTLGGVAGVLGSAFYGRVIGKRWDTMTMVRAAVWLGAPLSLLYIFYLGPVTVALVTVVLSFTGVVFRLALMDLAAQSCPDYGEATAFSLYMTVFNLAAWSSNTVGGKLYDVLRLQFGRAADPAYAAWLVLVLAGSATACLCWFLLPFLRVKSAA